jgi:hypothetical protein
MDDVAPMSVTAVLAVSHPLFFLDNRELAIVGNAVVEGVGSPDRAPERYYATMVHTRQIHVVFRAQSSYVASRRVGGT